METPAEELARLNAEITKNDTLWTAWIRAILEGEKK